MRFPWNRMETELKRELAHHLHELTAEFERRGHSREEAMRMAKREFGGSEQVKERCRDERRWAWMSGIRQDVAFALRQMRRSPGFAATRHLCCLLRYDRRVSSRYERSMPAQTLPSKRINRRMQSQWLGCKVCLPSNL